MRKANISFYMSVCLSVCVHASARVQQLHCHCTVVHELMFEYYFFRKSVEINQASLKSDKNSERHVDLL